MPAHVPGRLTSPPAIGCTLGHSACASAPGNSSPNTDPCPAYRRDEPRGVREIHRRQAQFTRQP